jgi:hypothetical protein
MLKHAAALRRHLAMLQRKLAILMSQAPSVALGIEVTERFLIMIAATCATFVIGFASVADLLHSVYAIRGGVAHAADAAGGGALAVDVCLAGFAYFGEDRVLGMSYD